MFYFQASGIIRREYDLKCKLLRQQDSKGESRYKIDKTRATVKDLHSRIRVAIHQITSISKRIEELRDKELQPQLEELIEGYVVLYSINAGVVWIDKNKEMVVGKRVFYSNKQALRKFIQINKNSKYMSLQIVLKKEEWTPD